jgi:hypothetical protein
MNAASTPLLMRTPFGIGWYSPNGKTGVEAPDAEAVCVLARYYKHSISSRYLRYALVVDMITKDEFEAIYRADGQSATQRDARLILALADRLGVPHSDTELPPQEER